MAEFCRECSIKIFGKDMLDFLALCQPDEITWVLCEGCGWIWVDSSGNKVEPLENKE